ncbi:helix-turn-helix domain-containing protein [Acetobacter cibinongensis]|uniref:helix-turn-helix domain-containing protein n=1 Tax=Acetobacter cibinongensis TaxID=146475 RepID=UPI0013FD823C|nr:helix-turn-helix transcriptional regulator [Acetobacter cibinongensis]
MIASTNAPAPLIINSALLRIAPRTAANPAPQSTVVTDSRQIDLEEATGTFRPNGVNELRINQHIGKRLRICRQQRKLSLPQLGTFVARSGQQIQKYETGHDAIKATTLFQLADALGVSLLWFFEGVA